MPKITLEVGITKEQAEEKIVKKFHLNYTPPLMYTQFMQAYGSTAGPMGGIGGQSVTTFILEAWFDKDGYAVVFYGDKILKIMDIFEFEIYSTYRS